MIFMFCYIVMFISLCKPGEQEFEDSLNIFLFFYFLFGVSACAEGVHIWTIAYM